MSLNHSRNMSRNAWSNDYWTGSNSYKHKIIKKSKIKQNQCKNCAKSIDIKYLFCYSCHLSYKVKSSVKNPIINVKL